MYLVTVNQSCVCERSPARRGVGYCIVAHAASPLPGSSYWLLMMWGDDVIKETLGSMGYYTLYRPTQHALEEEWGGEGAVVLTRYIYMYLYILHT